VNTIAHLLLECMKDQIGNSVSTAIRASRNRLLITSFDEPSYIDLHHYLENLQANLPNFKVKQPELITILGREIGRTLQLINTVVLANTTGKNLSRACGISIYFPEKNIDQSYPKTSFAQTNAWNLF